MAQGLSVSVKGDVKTIIKDLNAVQKKIVPQVTSSALNKTATKVRSVSAKHIARVKNISPQKLIKARLIIKKSNKRTQRAIIISLFAGVPVDKMSNSKKNTPGNAFKMRLNNGKEIIVTRKPKSKNASGRDRKGRVRKNRLPVDRVKISISRVSDTTIKRMSRSVGARHFVKTFEHDLQYRLRKRGLL